MSANCDSEPREQPRQATGSPHVSAIWAIDTMANGAIVIASSERIFYADVYANGGSECSVRSSHPIVREKQYLLSIFDRETKAWNTYLGTPVPSGPNPRKSGYYYTRFSLAPITDEAPDIIREHAHPKKGPALTDYEFFRSVPFLKAIHRDAVCPLLNSMTLRSAKAGERFIAQGGNGQTCYIVQTGHCQVSIEKGGAEHVISRIGPREFVGEMALLTGENRSAHVVAVTDMALWAIDRELFQSLVETYPEVGTFLTEIVAQRFATRTLTADRTIGKYRITDIIGRGGFAIVYKGRHEDLNRPVAVKMLNHDLALNPEFLANFRREAQTIANLNSENIVKVYDIEERFRTIFIIMELLEGMTLRQKLESIGRIPEKETVDILLKISKGLAYAHAKGLVHQDIKPGNIFILPDGGVKILDFGLACACGTENYQSGTPFYMSPEQVECLPVDERADVYALGLTAYEMTTGVKPFSEEDPFKAMNLHVEQPIPDPVAAEPSIHPDLRIFIATACKRNLDKRYQNASQVIAALKPLAHRYDLLEDAPAAPTRKVSTLLLAYTENQQLTLNKLLEEFSEKAKAKGIVLKAADFDDLLA